MFGCCSSYQKCSELKHCIHEGIPDYQDCGYNRNLKAGKIYYRKGVRIMEIKITISNIDDILKAINGLTNAVKGTIAPVAPVAPVAPAAPVVAPVAPVAPAAPVAPVEDFDDFLNEPPTQVYTFDAVKAKLSKLSQSGKEKEVKQLIMSFTKTCKLSDIPVESYPELMDKAGGIK